MRSLASVGVVLAFLVADQANAGIILFDLTGKADFGLTGANEVGATTSPGSGGEIGAGISFDDVTNVMTINVGWGSGNGFTDLSGDATAGHIHGPTPDPLPVSLTQNASVKYPLNSLAGWNASATNGGFSGTLNILAADVPALEVGRFYLNFHTATNPGGEIRGQLRPIPEPSTLALVGAAAVGLAAWRCRRRRPAA